jgi:hypothetical protein
MTMTELLIVRAALLSDVPGITALINMPKYRWVP